MRATRRIIDRFSLRRFAPPVEVPHVWLLDRSPPSLPHVRNRVERAPALCASSPARRSDVARARTGGAGGVRHPLSCVGSRRQRGAVHLRRRADDRTLRAVQRGAARAGGRRRQHPPRRAWRAAARRVLAGVEHALRRRCARARAGRLGARPRVLSTRRHGTRRDDHGAAHRGAVLWPADPSPAARAEDRELARAPRRRERDAAGNAHRRRAALLLSRHAPRRRPALRCPCRS